MDCGIILQKRCNIDTLQQCPASLKDLLEIIWSVQYLVEDQFGSQSKDSYPSPPTPVMQYQLELKKEAGTVAAVCESMQGRLEDEWVAGLKPIVFYRFQRAPEELYERGRHQHWYVPTIHGRQNYLTELKLPMRTALFSHE